MRILAKFYRWLRNNEVIAQELIDSVVTINEDISTYETCSFQVPIQDWIQEDIAVELYETSWSSDVLVFRWYVYKVSPVWKNWWVINIECNGEKAMMERRLNLGIWFAYGTTHDVVIQGLLDQYIPYNENWGLQVDDSIAITMQFEEGDNLYDIFDEIANNLNKQRTIKNGVVIMKDRIWKDLTGRPWSEWYQEITFDGRQPNAAANITNVKVEGIANRANLLKVKWYTWQVVTVQDYVDVLYGVWFQSSRAINWPIPSQLFLDTAANELLQKMNKPQRTFSVEVENNTMNADVWDQVRLSISNTNDFFDFEGYVFVTNKSIVYTNGSKNVSYQVAEFVVVPITDQNVIRNLQKKVKLIQLQT